MLEVRVLGGLSAAVDGRPVDLPSDARARELLARLAVSPGPHTRSVLAGRLRPDVPEESARKTLRNALYELRRSLGADAVVVTGDRIELAAQVDLREFRRHLAAGELAAAAAAGNGALLDGLDSDWALRARDEHAAELAGVLATLAAQCEDAGDLGAAVAWTRRRLDADPLSEAAHRDLIRRLALGGDRPAALAVASALADRLRTELGIPPSAATRTLVEDVRRGRVTAPGPARVPPLPAALAATAQPEGRAPALALLEQAWAEAAAGALRVVLVTGEPGIGKTTLAGELARRAHARGAAVLLGRSDEHALVPFQPWVEALEQLLQALPAAEADHWLTAHGGALARLLPARSPVQAEGGDRDRYLAFELVRALLGDLGWPVVLVLDDLHWADADSLSLLRHLGRSGALPLLIVVCARGAELEPDAAQTLAELRRDVALVHVELEGLDDDAVAAVLARRGATADAGRYRERSGGNPYFLDELLREGDIEGPPAGVREVIGRRLARLGEPTQRTLELAAACGFEFDVTTLAAAGERPVVDVLEALDAALAAGLVVPTERPERYAFAHALLGETITYALPASGRAQLHLRIADVLAERETAAGEVVRHLRAAGPLADAGRLATWEVTAARAATAALAHAEAVAHYEAALATHGDDRGELLLALGDANDRAGRREQARTAFVEAAELARAAGDADLLARAALGYGGTAVVIAAADPTAVRLLEEALVARPTDARLLARLSVELYYADPERARVLSARAVDSADGPAARAAALNARRVALWAPQHADERLAVAGEMVAAAEAAGDREAVLHGRNWRVVDLIELGRIDEAVAEIDAYAALADAVALPHFRWYVPLWRATLAQLAGRWDEARELGERALALGRAADDPNAPLFLDIQREMRLFAQHRIEDTDRERIFRSAAASAAPVEWLVYAALLDAESGALDDARRRITQLTGELSMNANWHGACILADATVQVGDRAAAARLYQLLEPHARLFPIVARAVDCLGSAEYYVGRLAGVLGRDDEAAARLRRAVDENERVGAAPPAATALLRLGEALGDRELLQQAASRADALGMAGVAATAQRRLG